MRLTACFLICTLAAGSMWAEEAPSSSSAEWERKASEWAVEAYQKALKDNAAEVEEFIKTRDAAPATLPGELGSVNKDREFVLFQRDCQKAIARKVPPTVEEAKVERLSVTLAPTEWEPLQFGVWSLKELKNFSYRVSDLAHSSGQ